MVVNLSLCVRAAVTKAGVQMKKQSNKTFPQFRHSKNESFFLPFHGRRNRLLPWTKYLTVFLLQCKAHQVKPDEL